MLKQIFLFIFLIFTIFSSIIVYISFVIHKPCQHNIQVLDNASRLNLTDEQIKRLQKALQIRTESFKIGHDNKSAKLEFIQFIRSEYKELEENYSFVQIEIISNYSLLYKIQGTQTNLKPYLLAAHFDVVPVAEEDVTKWLHDPFKGELNSIDKHIYGRGTMDDKASMLSQLEAIKLFLAKNKQPKRTIYLAYGHDEEITGLDGACQIAKLLFNQGVELEYVLDEGTMIVEDVFPGDKKPTALISVADKGYLTIRFSVNVTGGHSSMPNTDNSALFILSEAITKLKYNKLPSLMRYGPEKDLLEKLGVNLDFFRRILLTNIWLFYPLLEM